MLSLLRGVLAVLDGPLSIATPLIIEVLVLVLMVKVLLDAYAGPGPDPRLTRWSRMLTGASLPLLVAFAVVLLVRLIQLAGLI